jgi:hypothetical protein
MSDCFKQGAGYHIEFHSPIILIDVNATKSAHGAATTVGCVVHCWDSKKGLAMAELLVGAFVAVGLYALIQYTAGKNLVIKWWQWLLTVLGCLYIVFVLEVIVTFIREGSLKAAVVNGAILGFVAVVWAVLLGRFVFVRSTVEG